MILLWLLNDTNNLFYCSLSFTLYECVMGVESYGFLRGVLLHPDERSREEKRECIFSFFFSSELKFSSLEKFLHHELIFTERLIYC